VLKLQIDLPHYFVAHAFGASAYAIFAVGVFTVQRTFRSTLQCEVKSTLQRQFSEQR